MPLVRDEAICIRAWEWSATSQIVVAFARERGILRGVAKGARRLGGPYGGGFSPLTRGDIVFSTAQWEKKAESSAGQASGERLVSITAWEELELFPAARRSLHAFEAGCCMLELVQRGMNEADPHPDVYDALVHALRDLAAEPASALARFAWALLSGTGYAPSLDADPRTDQPHATSDVYAFAPRLGGFVSVDAPQSEVGPTWKVRAGTLDVLRTLAGGAACNQAFLPRAAKLLVMYFREIHQSDAPGLAYWLARQP